jgi:histidinol-phosphate aminotransferase
MERRGFVRASVALAGATLLPPGLRVPRPYRLSRLRSPAPPPPLRLNRNENPLGLSPAARAAIAAGLDEANRYPIELMPGLLDAIAKKHGVKPEQVLAGNGSTEVLQMAVQSLGRGASVIVADPTFEDVTKYADAMGTAVVKVPLRSDHSHDLQRMRETADRTDGDVLVYVCNPNNPTATLTSNDELDAWIGVASGRILFLVDEAYCDYADDASYRSAQPWIETRDNVLVTHTFSKIHAMAGMRLGYGLAHATLVEKLGRYRSSSNVNHLALVAGEASLGDDAFADKSRQANRDARAILCHCLDELGLDYIPSQANFMMHHIPGDLDTYIAHMKERGVWVGRPFPPMLGYNRISIGVPEEMQAFTEVLRSFRQQGWV